PLRTPVPRPATAGIGYRHRPLTTVRPVRFGVPPASRREPAGSAAAVGFGAGDTARRRATVRPTRPPARGAAGRHTSVRKGCPPTHAGTVRTPSRRTGRDRPAIRVGRRPRSWRRNRD